MLKTKVILSNFRRINAKQYRTVLFLKNHIFDHYIFCNRIKFGVNSSKIRENHCVLINYKVIKI